MRIHNPFNDKFLLLIAFTISIFSLIAVSFAPAQTIPDVIPTYSEISTSSDVISNISIVKTAIQAITNQSILDWLISNWYILILSVIGLARALIMITPTKKDNNVWNRYLVNPIRIVLSVLSLSKPTKQ